MNSETETCLYNLHVLASLQHNDKLITNEDSFGIHVPTSLRGAIRFWYGEGREQNVKRVRLCVRTAMNFCSSSFHEVMAMQTGEKTEGSDVMRMKITAIVYQHRRMMDGLKQAREGLKNFLHTYRDDATFHSQIGLLISEVDDFIAGFSQESSLTPPFANAESRGSLPRIPPPSAQTPTRRSDRLELQESGFATLS